MKHMKTQTSRSVKMAATKAAKAEAIARSARIHAETAAIVAADCCPQCGGKIRRNSTLTGWYQCARYFREDSAEPACRWQGFTE